MARFDVSYYTKNPKFTVLLCRALYDTNQEAIECTLQLIKERNEKMDDDHQIVGVTIYRYQPKTLHWKTIYEKRQL